MDIRGEYNLLKYINFSHYYDKLHYPIFCTIRGKSWFPIKSRLIQVELGKRLFCFAILRAQYCLQIKNIPLDLLIWDTAPIKIHSHYSFMELLNTFRSFNKLESTEDFVTILFLEKLL